MLYSDFSINYLRCSREVLDLITVLTNVTSLRGSISLLQHALETLAVNVCIRLLEKVIVRRMFTKMSGNSMSSAKQYKRKKLANLLFQYGIKY